jgi:RNA polymerase sigma-70 factor (ECF subfamily)
MAAAHWAPPLRVRSTPLSDAHHRGRHDTPADDPDLPVVHAIGAGDASACRVLVDRHLASLHAMATRLLDDAAEAEDVCQETFMKAWAMAPRWTPGSARFSTWLHGVALNACRDRLRRRRPQDDAALEALDDAAPGPSQLAEADATARRVHRAIAALPDRQREALVLCHFQELPQAEAAGLLDISVDALESLLARARRALRQALAAEGVAP